MRIAILAPITWRTPPRQYGPWEQVASVLTEGLVQRDLDVTLFATADSITKAKLQSVCKRPLGEAPADHKVWECLHISNLMEQADKFDIIHNHFDFLPLCWSELISTPMITTIHGFSSPNILPVYQKYNSRSHYVSISNSDRSSLLNYIGTVYNGIDESQFAFGKGLGNYLLYFGRIHPHKGAYEAIQIALRRKIKLIICGLIQDENYYAEKVHPFVDGENIVYLGNVGPVERNKLFGEATALLHPISFEEPFGLSVVESMMCGTPVVAFNRGSMKELIIDNRTGFLVDNTDEAVAAISKLSELNREDTRVHALENFSSKSMVDNYLSLYKSILNGVEQKKSLSRRTVIGKRQDLV